MTRNPLRRTFVLVTTVGLLLTLVAPTAMATKFLHCRNWDGDLDEDGICDRSDPDDDGDLKPDIIDCYPRWADGDATVCLNV